MNPSRKTSRGFHRKVLVSLLVSGGLLAIILSRLDLGSLAHSLAAVDGRAFMLTVTMFGCAIVATGLRWRIGLRLADVPLSLPVVARAMFGGHCFNMILLGPAGGDVAKSAAYSRWYDQPLHQLLASSIMDRSMAALASVLFIALTVALVLVSDTPISPGALMPDLSLGGWSLLALALALVSVGVTYRLRHLPFMQNMARSLRSTFRGAVRRPGSVIAGSLLGLGSQLLMSLAMAVALWSITAADVPWRDLLWTFPLITAVAALPTSFGGAGVREGVSILLLARYGIPAEDLVAAGFVYLAVQLVWAMLGAAFLAWEERRFTALARPAP